MVVGLHFFESVEGMEFLEAVGISDKEFPLPSALSSPCLK